MAQSFITFIGSKTHSRTDIDAFAYLNGSFSENYRNSAYFPELVLGRDKWANLILRITAATPWTRVAHLSGMARAVLVLACLFSQLSPAVSDAPRGQVHTEMHNVFYHFSDTVAVHIVHLEGELVPNAPAELPIFDDTNSFSISVRSAQISIAIEALANALNDYAFAASDAPLKAVRISSAGNRIKIRGRLHAKGDVPFETEGSLSVTSEGEIRFHTEKMAAAHVPVKSLLDLLGETVSKLIDTRKARGVRAEGDDLMLTPSELFPPPHLYGKLASIAIQGNQIIQEYGGPPAGSLKLPGNYMAYRGAELRFGKLTMHDTDLTLIDLDPQDPFDFYLTHYKDQLVAGYTKTTPTFGLKSYFRDYKKLKPNEKTRQSTPVRR